MGANNGYFKCNNVAILILLELTLQSVPIIVSTTHVLGRNPYFIGINSAIDLKTVEELSKAKSQSLFYWN